MTMLAPAIDPITFEVSRARLEGIAEEMQWTLLSTFFSAIVKEGQDASASLSTREGETLSRSVSIPTHLTTLIPCLANSLRTFPIDQMQDGDVFCMNDPYAGGTHIPDLAVIMPVFLNGAVVAFSATMTHHQNTGGMTPGSVPTRATDIFQEGFRIPALRLMARGVFDDTFLRLLRVNVRIPDVFIGDLNGQIAACRVGARGIAGLVEKLGLEGFRGFTEELLDRSESLTRTAQRRRLPGPVARRARSTTTVSTSTCRRVSRWP